jgi:two-component system, NtrC family, nitrogen regulation sensor histidine kinase NtrY
VTFRTKLLFISSITVAGAVALVTGAVSVAARRAFERVDDQRRNALLDQLRMELDARGAEIGRQMERAAQSPSVQQIVAGTAEYDRAQREAEAQGLDFFDVVQADHTILSSAHWPARFGYKNDWQIGEELWHARDSFFTHIPQPDGSVAPALVAVRPVMNGKVLVIGGRRVNSEFVRSLGQAPGMRALLSLEPNEVIDAQGGSPDAAKLASLIRVAETGKHSTAVIQWTSDRASSEAFLARLAGQIGVVLIAGTSLAAELTLEREILWIGVLVGASGIVIGVLMGWWTTERVTRPVEKLAQGARAVAAGDWSAHVDVTSKDELGELAAAFNRMTMQLIEQRDRAIQAERVAAWRELARRLAHELKNPLFPLQITIENLQRAHGRSAAEFDEVFRESTTTLLEELQQLKQIIGRFSDFARMPPPHFETVDLNEIVRGAVKLHAAQFETNGRPRIDPALELVPEELRISGDGEQLRRALGNLILNAIDAMPEGGRLRIATAREQGGVRLSVSDSGQGLTEEECSRLFTPYYTTKQHGTGLGLAIVQSVVSDHHGKISVQSAPGQGATFQIDLPGEAA